MEMKFNYLVLLIIFIGVTDKVMAEGQLSIGAHYDGWSTNYTAPTQDNGYEVYTPLAISYDLTPEWSFYAQSEFATANYVGPTGPVGSVTNVTTNLTNISDTVAGGKFSFRTSHSIH